MKALPLNAALLVGALLGVALLGNLASAQSADHHTLVDPSIRPADDFYAYANTSWLNATPLPDGASRIDTTSMLRAENARRVASLIADAAASPSTRGIARQVGDYYATLLDGARIEAAGLEPLSDELAAIAALRDGSDLAAYLGRTLRLDDGTNTQTESLWGLWVHQAFHDPDHYAAHFVQGGLGLSDKDAYLVPARRATYRAHVANVFHAAGFDGEGARADHVLDLETAIAATHASRADTDDVFKTDNSWRRADFVANAPGIDWNAYLTAAGLGSRTSFVIWQPQAVIGGSRLVATQPLQVWKDYLAFHLIEHYAGVLPTAFSDQRAPAADRAQQAIAATEAALGDAVGQMYVARYFSPQAKAAATAMVGNIRIALRARLANLPWMSRETKTKALAKLATLRVGLGYPESWIDISRLVVVRGDAFGNLQRAEVFAYRGQVAKLGHHVDPDEWPTQLHPQMVGAILNLSPNTMQFAAGLLQPPYFDATGDAASNYGSAGAGIAHEMTHSFDEVSNMFDERGRLVRWWASDDTVHYRNAIGLLAAQLDTCCPDPNACAHGAQIAGESSADLAGLVIAHDAYLLSLHGRPDVVINGLTGEQRFFIAFAQRWRRQQSDEDLQRQIATDTHAPPACRSNLVRNVDAWAQAFDVRPGDRLYVSPGARVRLW